MTDMSRRFCPICSAEVEMPVDVLASMAEAPALIAEAVRSASGSAGEGWSTIDIAHHLADTEVAWGWRVRQVLASGTPDLQPYDQDAWAAALRYRDRDAGTALAAFAGLRAAHVEMLRLCSEEEWERTGRHHESGVISLRALVQHKSHHDLDHLRQIRDSGRPL